MSIERSITLSQHPSAPAEAVRAIEALVRRTAAELQIIFRLEGDVSSILVPPQSAPCFAAQLWRHTCFEAFIAADERPGYNEFNFAPSGEWAVYAFSGYRNGGPLTRDAMRPRINLRSMKNHLELDAAVRLASLSATHPRASLHIGLAAIVETIGGLSYWALRHPADKPDFHHADGFALRLEPPHREG
ncbi:MAG TPA: DOMON-like domain-containing protein [Candidatus Binataceae bacterium]|nr:DOMON-like domain-containing protein [Candidatus Binataceae bacterium]